MEHQDEPEGYAESCEDMITIEREAKVRDRAEEKFKTDLYYQEMKLNAQLGIASIAVQKQYDKVEEKKDLVARKTATNYLGFFTLNFAPTTTIQEIQKCMSKIVEKKWLTHWWYSIEQRGETKADRGTGIHVHLLFHRGTKRPGSCKSEIFNSYARLQGRPYAKVKDSDLLFYPYEFFADKIEYMKGNKWDKEKDLKVKQDRKWRKKLSIDEIYSHDFEEEETLL